MAMSAMNTLLDENWEAGPGASRGEGRSRDYAGENGSEKKPDSHSGWESEHRKK